jgi:hypothetical protein
MLTKVYMTSRTIARPFVTLLSLVCFFGVLAIPAAAQQYQVTVTLTDDATIPAPLSYTFDTAHPFQSTDITDITNLSVTFDSKCGSNCSVGSVEYSSNGSQITYNADGTGFAIATGCLVWGENGNCSVNPSLNIAKAGVTYTASNGSIVVNALSVPETSSYLELSGFGLLGLALCCSRRFFAKRNS